MRVNTIAVAGADRPLFFSLRVMQELSDRFGGWDNVGEALEVRDSKTLMDVVHESLWILGIMLRAGAAYVRENGEEPPELPTDEQILDCLDYKMLRSAIFDTIRGDSARTVEAAPGEASVDTPGNPFS